MKNPVSLDVVGMLEGCDKSSSIASSWDYLRHYEAVFSEFRDENINVMEVGLNKGASLKIWKWFFSNARIVGIDIAPACRAYQDERVVVEIGSQADGNFLKNVCTRYPPTIFIDDGSHLAAHNIFTFEAVFPQLLPGGIYVVEDLAFHMGAEADRWQSDQRRDAPGYFLDLARHCLAAGRGTAQPLAPRAIGNMVESVFIIGSAVILRKHRAPRDADAGLAVAASYLEGMSQQGVAQERLAAWLLRHHGGDIFVEAAIEAAAKAGQEGFGLDLLRAQLLRRQKNPHEAIALLERAVAQAGRDLNPLRRAARELASLGAIEAALAAMDKVISFEPANPANLALREKLARRRPAS
jgi:tetratricopeptide (TPR) repeat protein